MSVLRLENVKKTFEGGPEVLRGISLAVEEGEVVAIIGPSGGGKSTLLRCMIDLEEVTGGSIYVGEDAMVKDGKYCSKAERARLISEMGMVFQSFNLIDELNVEENIELPLTYLNIPKAERKAKVQAIMKRMAISHRAKHFPHQLSGGQQQRVAIARAVVFGPKLILADEPTGNLDSKNGAEVMHLLTELNHEGTTIVMVTHNEHDAKIAHRTIRLFDGQIVETEGNQL